MSVFAANLINLNMSSTDKVAAIRELAELAVSAGRGTDAEQIVKDVLARDEMGTPQFDGVAIPHARSAGIAEATVLVGRSNSGIVFDPEEPGADVIFMILVPEGGGDEHITILSGLARRLMDPEFTAALRTSVSAEALVAVLGNGDN
ncbi:MAG: putative fructose-specific permease [Actinomycetota bacterium]|jgi:PTS system fructose-specific IIC component